MVRGHELTPTGIMWHNREYRLTIMIYALKFAQVADVANIAKVWARSWSWLSPSWNVPQVSLAHDGASLVA
jgi:hypothetical protein